MTERYIGLQQLLRRVITSYVRVYHCIDVIPETLVSDAADPRAPWVTLGLDTSYLLCFVLLVGLHLELLTIPISVVTNCQMRHPLSMEGTLV